MVTNRIIFVLALVGMADAAYLTLAHLNFVDLGCGILHGCDEVNLHESSSGFGIPVLKAIPTAAFGLMMYVALVALSMVRVASSSPEAAGRAARLQWKLACAGVAVTAWLTYLEAYVIHAWCQWCLASAFIILLIFLTATAERFGSAPPSSQGEAA